MKKLFYLGLREICFSIGIRLLRWPFLWLAKLILRLGLWASRWEIRQIMAPGQLRITLHIDHWEMLAKDLRNYGFLSKETEYALGRIEKDVEFHKRIHTPGAFEEWYQKLTGKLYKDSKERLKEEARDGDKG